MHYEQASQTNRQTNKPANQAIFMHASFASPVAGLFSRYYVALSKKREEKDRHSIFCVCG
jgi:hypothetical protein